MVLRPKSLFQSDTFFPDGSKESLFFCCLQFLALEAAYIQAPSCLEPAGPCESSHLSFCDDDSSSVFLHAQGPHVIFPEHF